MMEESAGVPRDAMPGASESVRPAAFLDRDGVLNRWRAESVLDPREFCWRPDAIQFIVDLTRRGWPIFVITNQAAISRGLVSRQVVDLIHDQMVVQAQAQGGCISGVFYCPHRPEEACGCRKPRPGLLQQVSAVHSIDLASSFFLGDSVSDMQAAEAAGTRGLLLRDPSGGSLPHHLLGTLDAPATVVGSFAAVLRLLDDDALADGATCVAGAGTVSLGVTPRFGGRN